jgi:hypothetical protein
MPPFAKTRDLRIDLARGLCLWFIFVDHSSVNVLSGFTLRSYAPCDAADAFVFLCGISAALAYGGKLDRAGWWEASKSALRRVRTIYLAQLALAAALIALLLADRALGQAAAGRMLGLQQWPALDAAGLLRLACLIDQPPYLEVLPLYMALLSWFALTMPLIRRPLLLLGLSAGLWIAVHLHPFGGLWAGTYYNLAAWQLTFTLGALCCRYAGLLRRPELRRLDIVAVGVIAAGACAACVLPQTWEAYDQLNQPMRALLRGVDKGNLDPARVLSVLALAWMIFRHVPAGAPWLRARWAAVLTGLGQRSLPVFVAGAVLSSLSTCVLVALHQTVAAEIAVNVVGIAGLVTAARLSTLRPSAIRRLFPAATAPASG